MAKTNSAKAEKPGKGAAPKTERTGAFQVSKQPLIGSTTDEPAVEMEAAAHKFEIAGEQPPAQPASAPEQQEKPAFEELGELPQSYGATTLYLIARDPKWLFSYWDVDWSAFPQTAMRDQERRFFLRLLDEDGREAFSTEINPDAKNWYLPVSKAGATYFAELGFFGPAGEWQSIARSDAASVPAETLAEESHATFATVPFHLTFQRLLEMVRNTMRNGETLMSALARVQGEGRRLAFGAGTAPGWTDEQRQVLAALFGNEVVERIGMGSGEIDQLLRQELLQKLSTESASELMAKGLLAAGESSLFSGILGGAGAALGAAGAFGSGMFSTAMLGGLGAWGSEVTSWLTGLTETGSSWSAQPFSQESGREFFMHVNAEVIFYGGTHPDAKVTIDGKPLQLNPDGTFRFHFKFPDANYEIPIVAVSPDGVEQRSATLRFERATSREGDVGHTAQPAELATPMGQRA